MDGLMDARRTTGHDISLLACDQWSLKQNRFDFHINRGHNNKILAINTITQEINKYQTFI